MDNFSSKNSFVGSHNFRFEFDTNINKLVRIDADVILRYREAKWKTCLGSAFQLKICFNLPSVNNPELLLDSIRILRRNQIFEVESVFLYGVNVTLNNIMEIDSSCKKRIGNNLLLENRLVVFGLY
jgi:hypothetical protein